MAYAKLKLSSKDKGFIADILFRRKTRLEGQETAASSEREKAFYRVAIEEYEALLLKFTREAATKMALTEVQLRTLRGALFGAERPEVAAAYRAALDAGDAFEKERLSQVLAHLERLDEELTKPLARDRSQDAEEDEEDEIVDEESDE